MATVLIVDDDPKLLNMLRRTLMYEGFHVLTANNGNEALTQVQAHRPDIIVLDWLMPGMDGIGVMKRLRAANDKTLILMLTARDAVENRVEGLESGADDYLVKPFAPAELLARIHALLRRPAVAQGVCLTEVEQTPSSLSDTHVRQAARPATGRGPAFRAVPPGPRGGSRRGGGCAAGNGLPGPSPTPRSCPRDRA